MAREPIRTIEVALTGEYEGYTATMRLNPPFQTKMDLRSGNVEKFFAACGHIILAWNAEDDTGAVIPAPHDDPGAAYRVSDYLLVAYVNAYIDKINEATEIPKA